MLKIKRRTHSDSGTSDVYRFKCRMYRLGKDRENCVSILRCDGFSNSKFIIPFHTSACRVARVHKRSASFCGAWLIKSENFRAKRGQAGHLRDGKRLFKWLQLMWSINLLYALRPLQINFTPAACRLIMWQRAGDVPSPSGWKKRRTDRRAERRTGGRTGLQQEGQNERAKKTNQVSHIKWNPSYLCGRTMLLGSLLYCKSKTCV